jgi:hypothetical protein
MATHDYVIANGTGAAVRADLNNALAAIVSNNSGTSEPATTYAYQWWADTTNNLLKLRNSANNAWITLRELDGTLLMEDGSASTPGLSFASDTNTGFFSGGADKIGFATGGAERLEIGSSEVVFNDPSNDVDFRVESNSNTHMLFVDSGNNRLGIGESSPDQRVHISQAASGTTMGVIIQNTATDTNSDARLTFNTNSGGAEKTRGYIQATGNTSSDGNLIFATRKSGSTSESARIDSSGRLLVGTSTSRIVEDHAGNGPQGRIQIEATNSDAIASIISAGTSDANRCGTLSLGRHRNSTVGGTPTVVQDGDALGAICFAGGDGTDMRTKGAKIVAEVDGAPGSNDMPGRLILATTADNGANPTERVRIDSSGRVLINETSAATADSFLTVKNGSGSCELNIMSGPTSASVINLGDTGDYNIGRIKYDQSTNSLQFNTNNGERVRILSGGGITFNGDTAAANALDDYEEGSFTPSIRRTGSQPTATYSSQGGQYVKVGSMVLVWFDFSINALSGGSGTYQIQGLPFSADANNTTGGYGSPQFRNSTAMNFAAQQVPSSYHDGTYITLKYMLNQTTENDISIGAGRITGWSVYPI